MEKEKITYQYADTGHWLARCNHQSNVIELNAREFGSLSPLMKDYVWVHECVHLLTDVSDEAECNRLADEIFISRATSDKDKAARMNFIKSANDHSFSKATGPMPKIGMLLLVLELVLFIILKYKKL